MFASTLLKVTTTNSLYTFFDKMSFAALPPAAPWGESADEGVYIWDENLKLC